MVMSKRPMITMKRSCSCSMPGVLRAVIHNEGAAVIFHSPKACGHVANNMDLGGHYRAIAQQEFVSGMYQAPLFISGLQEEHSIFGGTELLRQCIDEVVLHHKPSYIVIANSCVAGVIGDDTQAVAAEAEEKWGIPIMAVPCGGFLDGEYHAGFYYTGKMLAERLMTPQKPRKETVTLLGDRGCPAGADVQEMKELLALMGLNVHSYFPVYSSLQEIQQVPASEFCILLAGRTQSYEWIKKLAEDIKKQFGIPYFDQDYPIGWQATKLWLERLGQFLQRPETARQAIDTQENRLNLEKQQSVQLLKQRKVTFCIGRPLMHFDPSWVFDLIEQSGAILENVILLTALTKEQQSDMLEIVKQYTQVPVFKASESDRILNQADLVVTTHELDDQHLRQFFLSLVPPAGVGGLVTMLKKFARLTKRVRKHGGVIYG
jgi:nitrogenase molybdenum-iron protein alpha chain